jgi:hypothetical protein
MSAIVLRRRCASLWRCPLARLSQRCSRNSRPETPVTCDTQRCDALPTSRESISRTLASEQPLGGLLDERPAIRTWVRDVRRFWDRPPSSTPSLDRRASSPAFVIILTDPSVWNHCQSYASFVQTHQRCGNSPQGPQADAARFLGPYQRTVSSGAKEHSWSGGVSERSDRASRKNPTRPCRLWPTSVALPGREVG